MSDALLTGAADSRRGVCVVAARSEAGAWQPAAQCIQHITHSKVNLHNTTHTTSDHLSITCLASNHRPQSPTFILFFAYNILAGTSPLLCPVTSADVLLAFENSRSVAVNHDRFLTLNVFCSY